MSESGSFGSSVGNHGGEVRRDRGSDVFSQDHGSCDVEPDPAVSTHDQRQGHRGR